MSCLLLAREWKQQVDVRLSEPRHRVSDGLLAISDAKRATP